MKLNIKNTRMLYAYIWSKDQPKRADQRPVHRATFTIDEDHAAVEQIRETALAALTDKVGAAKAERWIDNNFGIDKKTGVLHWGDKRDEPSEDFDGMRFFTAKNDSMPKVLTSLGFRQFREGTIRDEDGDDIEMEKDEHGRQIYPGCMVNITVNIVGYDNDNDIGVSIYLLGIKFRADGEEQKLGATADDDDLADDDEDVAPKKVVAPAKKKKA